MGRTKSTAAQTLPKEKKLELTPIILKHQQEIGLVTRKNNTNMTK